MDKMTQIKAKTSWPNNMSIQDRVARATEVCILMERDFKKVIDQAILVDTILSERLRDQVPKGPAGNYWHRRLTSAYTTLAMNISAFWDKPGASTISIPSLVALVDHPLVLISLVNKHSVPLPFYHEDPFTVEKVTRRSAAENERDSITHVTALKFMISDIRGKMNLSLDINKHIMTETFDRIYALRNRGGHIVDLTNKERNFNDNKPFDIPVTSETAAQIALTREFVEVCNLGVRSHLCNFSAFREVLHDESEAFWGKSKLNIIKSNDVVDIGIALKSIKSHLLLFTNKVIQRLCGI